MNLLKKSLILIAYILLVSLYAKGQTVSFKHFGIEEGLIHPSVYTINQDKNGFLWIGTGEGICRFDGLKFSRPTSLDTLVGAYSNFCYRSKDGNVWIGYDDGSVFVTDNLVIKNKYRNASAPSIITWISELSNGSILVATQSNGILIFNNNTQSNLKLNDSKIIYTVEEIDQNRLLIGSNDGLWIARRNGENSYIYDSKINAIPETKINCIIRQKNRKGFWIGTAEYGLFQLTYNPAFEVQQFAVTSELKNINIQWVLEDKTNNLWLCTFGKGIYKYSWDQSKQNYILVNNYNQNNGLGDNYIKHAFQDIEGNIWIGTYSNGLTAIMDEAFVFYKYTPNDILSIAVTKEDVWLGSRGVIFRLKNLSSTPVVLSPRNGIPNVAITALALSDEQTLWIGTENSGIYKMSGLTNIPQKFFSSENSVENTINKLVYYNNTLWAATNGGLFAFNLLTGKITKYSTDTELPHNKINDVYIDKKGNVWVATKGQGLYSVLSNKHLKIEGGSEIEFTAITEDKEGNLWASSYGDGVFGFMKDSIINLTEKKGLKSDYGYSIITDEDGSIWVGHRLGISRIHPATHRIITYSTEIGILGDCNPLAVNKDAQGNIRWGTTNGVILYNFLSQKQQHRSPPQVNIISVRISDKEYEIGKPIVLPYGKYRVRIEFVGINFRSPRSVRYQYKLEGWDMAWSEFTDANFAYYPRLEDGKYKFLVRAINAEGLSNETPVEFSITIQPPLWKRWWFISLSIIGIVALLYFYIKYRERKQRKFQEYLEKLLDERTREVMQQKEVIEMKNRDITDSITYAQRIQNSILPSIKKLQELFAGSFIFYQPKDIVSGDFYWFDKISDNKFVIVCGDSTGHGVPGALMSMIGTTLIKDICNRPDVIFPSDILVKLDEEMRSTLNQNFEHAESSDGMDLIACEIDLQNYQITIASAMRPVILYKNGEQIYVSGSKSSIGGIVYKNEYKCFENQTYQLGRGDLIYMFSDGYPDQFGGPLGKKFKMVRLRNLLEDIHNLPMEEQYFQIKNNFNLWKGQFEQVDDVLFMGIRL
ncbi:MAG: SpoIIE family protein phosphatase [Bacteroidales bacterium]|nr:SpoIIE family protein phosphatase [Bacteroidales bacterium]